MVTVTREPILHPVPTGELRPTQMTVGMREVKAKRKQWQALPGDRGAEFLGRHMLPAVLGPKRRYYVVDHLGVAPHTIGVVRVHPIAVVEHEPERVRLQRVEVGDDGHRHVRYALLWADFLRRRIKRKVAEARFAQALERALALARSEAASYLPGWCGPVARKAGLG